MLVNFRSSIAFTLIKLVCFPINGTLKLFGTKYFSSLNFVNGLILIAMILIFLLFIIFPIFLLVISCIESGFYKSALSFEFLEKKLQNTFIDYNIRALSKPAEFFSMLSHKKVLKKFKIFYNVSVCLLVFVTMSILIFLIKSETQVGKFDITDIRFLENVAVIAVMPFSFSDILIGLYLILKMIILLQLQVEKFYEYLNVSINNKIDIESTRILYNCVYEHVKTTDYWLRYFCGFIYILTVPSICIFLYVIILGQLEISKFQSIFADLMLALFLMVYITIIAVILHSKVILNSIL